MDQICLHRYECDEVACMMQSVAFNKLNLRHFHHFMQNDCSSLTLLDTVEDLESGEITIQAGKVMMIIREFVSLSGQRSWMLRTPSR